MSAKINSFKSTCTYCGIGCGVIIEKDTSGKIKVSGDKDHPVNKGFLCNQGIELHQRVSDQDDRLLLPEMRWNRNMPRQKVSWDTALTRAAAVFKTFISKYGPDSVGFYVSGQCLTEEYYILSKLVKGFLGTNNISTSSSICASSQVTAYKLAFGEYTIPGAYEDIELGDCFFISETNPAWCHPILFKRLERHKEKNPEVKIIVADSRKNQTCAIADIHLQIKPGTEVILYRALGRFLIENNLIDKKFIDNHTEGFEYYCQKVFERTIEEASSICDIPVEDIMLAAGYIGKSKGYISMWANPQNQSPIDINKSLSLINLSLITGKIGKAGSSPFSFAELPNAIAGIEAGGISNSLPSYRNIYNSTHREEVAEFWGIPELPINKGLSATEMFDNLLSGKLKAIWIVSTNPLASLPNARNIEVALKNSKFVVVQDISSKSETIPFADLILPAADWTETEGTLTTSERRISMVNKISNPLGEALPNTEIITRFARKMGFDNSFSYKGPSDIYDEYCKISKGTCSDISKLSFSTLREKQTVHWPFTIESEDGVKRLFSDNEFYTLNKRAKIQAVPENYDIKDLSQNFPLILTSGKIRDQWNNITKSGKIIKPHQLAEKPFLEINETDARNRSIKSGDVVEVFNEQVTIRVTAQYSSDIKKGVVHLPMGWAKILNREIEHSNYLTDALNSQMSKTSGSKYIAVQVKKYIKKKEKIIVIGAGVGSSQFIRKYRKLNPDDEIHIFSREKNLFYNRIMLPGYISGKQEWNNLIKINEEEILSSKVFLHKSTTITSVNPGEKFITDHHGKNHTYDTLIIATGSRPALPREVPKIQGIFTLRSKDDADIFKKSISPDSKVIIVGGGLLGLELADALNQLSIRVSIVQRSSRLMNKQLDVVASNMLHEELSTRNISFYYNDEVLVHQGKEKITGVKLKSGKDLTCDLLVYTIGTQPNIELAQVAGLNCNRGIVVNEFLQTNNKHIYAIGEIAEFEKSLFESTTAAEEQADIAAGYLNGDETNSYCGTLPINVLKVSGFDLCSIGMIEVPAKNEGEFEEIVYIDKSKRYYKKCIVQNDKLVGAILVGDKSEFPEFKNLIRQNVELADKRVSLLLSNKNKQTESRKREKKGVPDIAD